MTERNSRAQRWAAFGATIFPLLCAALLAPALAGAETLTLAVHPALPKERTLENFQPLADYLSQATGHRITLTTSPNFVAHWHLTLRGEHQLVLDGPHFTDYRIRKMGYHVLARFPDTVSATLVAHEDLMIIEPAELVGRPISAMSAPALATLQLASIFPNPMRQPEILETPDGLMAAEQVLRGEAAGAIIPSPLVGRFPALTPVLTTPAVPAPAISAAPSVPPPVREAIRRALLGAAESEAGRAALAAMSLTRLEPATPAHFLGNAELLKDTWGY